MYSNSETTLTLYKESFKGLFQDYVIKFNHEHCEIEKIIPLAFDVVQHLIRDQHLKDKTIKARLVALVSYVREDQDEKVNVYHPSFQSEFIDDAEDFFITHMLKIAQRIEAFNQNGSNLIIQCIPEIHLHITYVN